MVFIGIDPGKSGALMAINDRGKIVCSCPFGRDEYIHALSGLSSHFNCKCVVEHVSAMPKQGCVSMFNFGENFGFIRGVLEALKIPYELVRPQKWKRVFSCTSDKNTSIEVAKRLFPGAQLIRTSRCRKPDDGIAEALLMAEYSRRTQNGI